MSPAERPLARRERLRVAVADLDDLDDRLAFQDFAVLSGEPLGVAAHHRATGAGLVDRGFEIGRIPIGNGPGNRFGIGGAAQAP